MDITDEFFDMIYHVSGDQSSSNPLQYWRTYRSYIGSAERESPFIASARAIQEEIDELSHEIVAYTRHYLRTSVMSLGSGISSSSSGDGYSSHDIQMKLQQSSDNIESLQSLLREAEFIGNASTATKNISALLSHASSQQRAHYHAILMSLFERFQNASKKFQLVQLIQSEDEQYKKRLFQVTEAVELSAEELEQIYAEQKKAEVVVSKEEEKVSKTVEQKRVMDNTMAASDSEDETPRDAIVGIHMTHNESLSEQLLQQLEIENRQLLMDFEGMMDDVKETEQSAVQITELISLFENKVSEEAELIDLLYDHSQHSHQNIVDANVQLEKVEEKATKGMFRFFLVYVFLFASFWILFMHFIHS